MVEINTSNSDSIVSGSTQRPFSWQGRLIALAYGLFFVITLWVAYQGHLPDWFQGIPNYDKPAHVILYAIATYLGHRLLNYRHTRLGGLTNPWRIAKGIPLFPLGFAIFTTVEELSQGLSPNRTLDGLDLVCSFVGVGLGYWLAERSRHKQRTEMR